MQTTKRFILLILSTAVLASCSDGRDQVPTTIDVTIANLNVLHGFDCDPPLPGDGDQCRVRERIALLVDLLIERGCPDIVTLQEVVNKEFVQRSPTEAAGPLDSIVDLLEQGLPELTMACGFTYNLLYQPFLPSGVAETDEELILSRYPILHSEVQPLHSALYDIPNAFLIFARHVLYTRIAHPVGEIDIYTTHLSSGSDSATNSCDSFRELIPGTGVGPRVDCPMECDTQDTVRACQSEQLALYVERTRGNGNLALISGDFNALPGSSEYRSMTNRGWLDSHLAAGQGQCDAVSGSNCTSGRGSSSDNLENPALNTTRRIDYIFVASAPGGNTPGEERCRVDDAGLFAGEPNPFADRCGPPPAAMCWVSDHSGNYARISCER
jgi:endonuclease/exonuclease/phosphatase family metal-dependent hydrolase